MITALDANVLFDVLRPKAFTEKSIRAIEARSFLGSLIVCEIVYAELCFNFASRSECDRFLLENRIDISTQNRDSCFLASRAWQKYRRLGGPRVRVLPDFFIGAHARIQASCLLTRDAKFYRTYFPDLQVIDPTDG